MEYKIKRSQFLLVGCLLVFSVGGLMGSYRGKEEFVEFLEQNFRHLQENSTTIIQQLHLQDSCHCLIDNDMSSSGIRPLLDSNKERFASLSRHRCLSTALARSGVFMGTVLSDLSSHLCDVHRELHNEAQNIDIAKLESNQVALRNYLSSIEDDMSMSIELFNKIGEDNYLFNLIQRSLSRFIEAHACIITLASQAQNESETDESETEESEGDESEGEGELTGNDSSCYLENTPRRVFDLNVLRGPDPSATSSTSPTSATSSVSPSFWSRIRGLGGSLVRGVGSLLSEVKSLGSAVPKSICEEAHDAGSLFIDPLQSLSRYMEDLNQVSQYLSQMKFDHMDVESSNALRELIIYVPDKIAQFKALLHGNSLISIKGEGLEGVLRETLKTLELMKVVLTHRRIDSDMSSQLIVNKDALRRQLDDNIQEESLSSSLSDGKKDEINTGMRNFVRGIECFLELNTSSSQFLGGTEEGQGRLQERSVNLSDSVVEPIELDQSLDTEPLSVGDCEYIRYPGLARSEGKKPIYVYHNGAHGECYCYRGPFIPEPSERYKPRPDAIWLDCQWFIPYKKEAMNQKDAIAYLLGDGESPYYVPCSLYPIELQIGNVSFIKKPDHERPLERWMQESKIEYNNQVLIPLDPPSSSFNKLLHKDGRIWIGDTYFYPYDRSAMFVPPPSPSVETPSTIIIKKDGQEYYGYIKRRD